MRGHRGATPSVVRTLEGKERTFEGATCPLCNSSLEFDTVGEFSQLAERCSGTNNPACPNRRWHRPAPVAQLPPDPPASEKKRPGRKPAETDSSASNFGRYSDA